MEYLHSFDRYLRRRFLVFQEEQTAPEVSKWDTYLNSIYTILSWQHPKLTTFTLVSLAVIIRLVLLAELRFYGLFFGTLLIFLLCDCYLELKNLYYTNLESMEAIYNISEHFSEIVMYVKAIRSKHHMPFCIVMCMLFLWLTVIAHCITGVTLTYLGLVCVFMGPSLISRLPLHYFNAVKECLQGIGSNQEVAESELIPCLSIKEDDIDMDSFKTERTMDSLISGITSMPSYLDADKDLEEDLELAYRLSREPSTDTDSDKKSMEFESSHFNGDTSSEEENKYHKDLEFSDVTSERSNTNSAPSDIFTNLTSFGGKFISKVLQQKSIRKDSDSDFEIIDSDEVDNL